MHMRATIYNVHTKVGRILICPLSLTKCLYSYPPQRRISDRHTSASPSLMSKLEITEFGLVAQAPFYIFSGDRATLRLYKDIYSLLYWGRPADQLHPSRGSSRLQIQPSSGTQIQVNRLKNSSFSNDGCLRSLG
jgi:hypothetical protein